MKFPIFASFIAFCLFVTITVKKQTADDTKKEESFWERERKANAARKLPLDNLPFIHLPFETLPKPELNKDRPVLDAAEKDSLSLDEAPVDPTLEPSFEQLSPDEQFTKLYATLEELDREGIINFSDKSNTDLKLEYGVANLETLTLYDQNYTDTLIGLDSIGHLLADECFEEEALKYLEYAVSIRSDISTTYELLVSIYKKKGLERKIENLVPIAQNLKSLQKAKILELLQS